MQNKYKFLITTGLTETWNHKKNDDLLFLGHWCLDYINKDIWLKKNYEVLEYHWEDFEKLLRDEEYLDKFYEQILSKLTIVLNKYHKTSYDKKYWRILLNPWLNTIIYILTLWE